MSFAERIEMVRVRCACGVRLDVAPVITEAEEVAAEARLRRWRAESRPLPAPVVECIREAFRPKVPARHLALAPAGHAPRRERLRYVCGRCGRTWQVPLRVLNAAIREAHKSGRSVEFGTDV